MMLPGQSVASADTTQILWKRRGSVVNEYSSGGPYRDEVLQFWFSDWAIFMVTLYEGVLPKSVIN